MDSDSGADGGVGDGGQADVEHQLDLADGQVEHADDTLDLRTTKVLFSRLSGGHRHC